MRRLAIALVLACSSPAPRKASPPGPWRTPAGWKSETIPFPLDFAPAVAHQGVEELRFAPGFFKAGEPGYWSYAFVWRTKDAAALDAAALGGELTVYFKGLVTAVDADKHQVADPAAIAMTATAAGDRFTLAGKVFDAFGKGEPVELAGWASRRACGTGALWVVVLAPPASPVRAELDALAGEARCDQ